MAEALVKPRRRFFRFSLRTLFVLLTVLGIGLGWVMRERQIVRERWAMRGWLQSQDAWVVSNILWEGLSISGSRHQTRPRREKLAAIQRRLPSAGPLPLVRRWLGDEYVEGIWLPDTLSDRRDEIQGLFPESAIVLQSEVIYDEYIERGRRIQQALSEPTRFEFASASLQDAIDYLSDLHNVDIRLDPQALENAQIDSEIPLTFQAQDIPLAKALANLLAPFKLTFVVRQAVVKIVTEDVAQAQQ